MNKLVHIALIMKLKNDVLEKGLIIKERGHSLSYKRERERALQAGETFYIFLFERDLTFSKT